MPINTKDLFFNSVQDWQTYNLYNAFVLTCITASYQDLFISNWSNKTLPIHYLSKLM